MSNRIVVVIADNEIDLIQEDCKELRAHITELKEDFGCSVKTREFYSWDEANAYEAKLQA